MNPTLLVFRPLPYRWTLGALVWMVCATTYAGTDFIPHALARYQHESNLFAIPEDQAMTDTAGNKRLDDNTQEYSGGIDIDHRWREDRFYVTTNYDKFIYQYFTKSNHDEFNGTAGIDWVATRKVKGDLTYQYNRHQVSFGQILNPDPNLSYIQTDKLVHGSAAYEINSHWSANFGASFLNSKLPDAGLQSFEARQTQYKTGVLYTGATRLKSGFTVTRETGEYENTQQPGYTRTIFDYTANYKIGVRTDIGGSLGHTQQSQATNSNSATTGSFTFTQQATVKTSYFFRFSRSLDVYDTIAGSQIVTNGLVGVSWQATQKLSASATYAIGKSHISGSSSSLAFANREDKLKIATIGIKYTALRWLTISPHYLYQDRNSDVSRFSFKATTYGIDFDVRFNP